MTEIEIETATATAHRRPESRHGLDRMNHRSAALQVFLAAAMIIQASAVNADETVDHCLLRLLDERGLNVAESVTLCRDDQPDVCFDKAPNSEPVKVDMVALRIEGEGHGPVTAKPEKAADGICTATVPRKANVTISFDPETTRSLKASFYRPDEDPGLFRPARSDTLDRETTVRIPAGPYVLSMTTRGWAPDLRLIDASPGSSHSFRYQQRDGWSVVIRTVADHDDTSVADAEIEIRTLPGFDEPGSEPQNQELKPRTLMERRSGFGGLVVVSGLRVPVAAAAVRHEQFLDTDIPAFSSDTGTFRVFEARLHKGGSIAVRVVREATPAVKARCELTLPGLEKRPPWGLGETLHAADADFLGVCRATKIPAGLYALKVSLPDHADAHTIQPIVVKDGETSDPTVELWPITVTGRVQQGEQGAAGYEVKFERAGPFEVETPFYPAGRVTTDEDGNYEIVVWAAGEYLGQVSTESTTAGNFVFVELHSDETIDFRLAVAELEGQVVDDSGTLRPEALVTIKSPNLQRGVTLDEDAHFRISFRDESGMVELVANEEGFHKSEPVKVMIDKDQMPDPVILVIRRRQLRSGRVVLPSGQPAVGTTVSVHRFDPDQYAYPVERLVADASGRIDISFETGPLRLFYGGPGCALGSFDLSPISSGKSLETLAEEPPFEIRCEPPSHLIVRLVTDNPELRGGAPVLLRRDDVVVPPDVLERHLLSLGLPTTTDG